MNLSERQPRETARDYAIRTIRENIVSMGLEPGCMVSENELAQEMGLSRTPVREALIELSKSGIVEIFPQHGSMVSRIDNDRIEEAVFTRRVLEMAVVREVCRMATDADIRGLDENLSMQELFLDRDNAERLLALDNEFHRSLFRIAKKLLSHNLICGLSTHYDRVRQLSLVIHRNTRIVEAHRAILQGIQERDPDKAEKAMCEHLNRFQQYKDTLREKYAVYFAD